MNLVQNLAYRPAGIFVDGPQKTFDRYSNGLLYRLNGSLYCVERMNLMHKLESHDGCVNCINFNKSGRLLATGSDDLHLKVWDWARNKEVYDAVSHHNSNVFQVKFLENGQFDNQKDLHLISSARDAQVRLTSITPSGDSKTRGLLKHNRAVHKIAIPDQCPNLVLTAGEDGQVARTDLRDKKPEFLVNLRVEGVRVPIYSVAAHPYKSEFCICGRDKFVRVYDERNYKECVRQFCPEGVLKVG